MPDTGRLDELEVYRGLGVGEVWREGVIKVYVRAGDTYERRERSTCLPDIDLVELARHIDVANQTRAVTKYLPALRRR